MMMGSMERRQGRSVFKYLVPSIQSSSNMTPPTESWITSHANVRPPTCPGWLDRTGALARPWAGWWAAGGGSNGS